MSCAIQCYAVTPAVYHLFYIQRGFLLPHVSLGQILSATPTFFNWKTELTEGETLSRVTLIEPGDVGKLWAWKEKSAFLSVAANRIYLEGECLDGETAAGDMAMVSVLDAEHHARQSLLTPEYFTALHEHLSQDHVFNPLVFRAFFTELVRWRDLCVEHHEYLTEMNNLLPYLKAIHRPPSSGESLQ